MASPFNHPYGRVESTNNCECGQGNIGAEFAGNLIKTVEVVNMQSY